MMSFEERAADLLEQIQRGSTSHIPDQSAHRLLTNALRDEFNAGLQAGSQLALRVEQAAREVLAAEDAMASTVNADSATATEADRRYDAAWAALRGALAPG